MAAVKGVGRLNKRLGRHAAHPGAGGAVRPVIDQQKVVGLFADLAQSRQAGGSGADDNDILDLFHGSIPSSSEYTRQNIKISQAHG